MFIENLGDRDINISHDLSLREHLKKNKRLKNKRLKDFYEYPYWGAILEKRCGRVNEGV